MLLNQTVLQLPLLPSDVIESLSDSAVSCPTGEMVIGGVGTLMSEL